MEYRKAGFNYPRFPSGGGVRGKGHRTVTSVGRAAAGAANDRAFGLEAMP